MKLIGITGGIGSGKSMLTQTAARFGYPCFDADALSREIMDSGVLNPDLERLYGPSVLKGSGEVDRQALRGIIFAHEDARLSLEGLVHPRVQALFASRCEQIREGNPNAWIFYEASLIFECNRQAAFDKIILVRAPWDCRVRRLQARGLDVETLERIRDAQWTDERKAALAARVLDNSQDRESMKEDFLELLSWLWDEFSQLSP